MEAKQIGEKMEWIEEEEVRTGTLVRISEDDIFVRPDDPSLPVFSPTYISSKRPLTYALSLLPVYFFLDKLMRNKTGAREPLPSLSDASIEVWVGAETR